MRTLLLSLSLLVCAAGFASAEVIVSAPGGGVWSDAATWVGGAVPGAEDDVLIVSTVFVDDTAWCGDLEIALYGVLDGYLNTYNNLLHVVGDILCEGEVHGSPYPFEIEVAGDLDIRGIWNNHTTTLMGAGEHYLTMGESAHITSRLEMDETSPGSLTSLSPLSLNGSVDLNGGVLNLMPGHDLSFDNGSLGGGTINCNGNTVNMGFGSYLAEVVLDQAVIDGTIRTGMLTSFTGGLTNMGIFQNFSSSGNGAAVIAGGFVNHGTVRNDNYGFAIFLSGDLSNHGQMTQSTLFLDGVGEQHLSMGPDTQIDCPVYFPEFQGGIMVADTDLRFNDLVNLGSGELRLENGSSVTFLSYGSFTDGTLEGGGNALVMEGNSFMRDIEVYDTVLRGVVKVEDDTEFAGDVTVADILENRQYFGATVQVAGDLFNEGLIRDQGHTFTVIMAGDFGNSGFCTNSIMIMEGSVDQFVGTGDGIDSGEFRLKSGLSGSGYQWYRDGAPLAGATGSSLSFYGGIGEGDHGVYHCETDGGVPSRRITISEFIDLTAVAEGSIPAAHLAQNHPNPFNPQTTFSFTLADQGHTRLTVYDGAGRRVALLVDRELGAGNHNIPWRPAGIPSGIYLYKLEAGGQVQSRKSLLVK